MKSLFVVLCLTMAYLSVGAQKIYKFQNTKLSDEKRIDALLEELMLEEKIALLGSDLAVPRLGILSCRHHEGLHGLALGGPAAWGGRKKGEDGKIIPTDRPTTIFPQSYGLGATWDVDLVKKVGEQASLEARYYMQRPEDKRTALVMRAPNADLARDPRWGRTEESYGEDAFLTARLTVANIKGLQGDNPRYWRTAALMKHFLANSNEDRRDSTSSNFDMRLFYEYYAYPFYKGITEGESHAFMAAYNGWNGPAMCVHPCLKEITRDKWGNNGIICTDGGALKLLVNAHHAYPTMAEGAAAVVKATTGQFLDVYKPYIEEALEKGLLTEKDIDKAIRGNLYVALRLGLLDGKDSADPYKNIGTIPNEVPPYEREEAKQLAREVTAKSVVLLKNSKNLLPLNASKLKKIAVIGPYADKIVQDWYSGTPAYEITILEGIRNAMKDGQTEVIYATNNAIDEAVNAAREAVVCVGNHPYGTRPDWFFCPVPSDGREAVDRKSLMLPDEDLLKQVYKANPNTILVLVSSFPYTINWSQENLPAILHITHCSQEQGNGLADVLFGKVNPSGHTTQTWVKDITDLPDMMDYDIRNGRTYMYYKDDVLYPFGYGLSYTTFDYQQIKSVKQDKDKVTVTVLVKNSGSRDGEEVVQLYASYPESKVERPMKQLRAFSKVPIAAGDTKEVVLDIPKEDFAYWDEIQDKFVVEPGKVKLLIGASSADIRLEGEVTL
mgnify:FL=1